MVEEANRFMKGATEQRHTRTMGELAQHLAHAQVEHRWTSDFVAMVGGSRVERDGPVGTKLRGVDLWRVVDLLDEVVTANTPPSASNLFTTATYLGDAKSRRELLTAMEKGAARMLSAVRQFCGLEPINTTGSRTHNIPIPSSVGKAMQRRKPHQSDADRSQAALNRWLETTRKQLAKLAATEEERRRLFSEVTASLTEYPPTLAGPDGEKPKADKASVMAVVEEWAGPVDDGDLRHPAHAFDVLQFLMREAAVSAKRTLRAVGERLAQAILRLLPAEAEEVYLCFDRLLRVPAAKQFEQAARSVATAGKDGAAWRRMAAVIQRGAALDPDTVIDTAWMAADRIFRQHTVHVVAEVLLSFPWPDHLVVTVDSELASDPAAPPMTVVRGERRARPELAHVFGEADGAMWHLLRSGGRGGVVHTADADAVDYAVEVCLDHPEPRPTYVVRYPTSNPRVVNITRLVQALERGQASSARKKAHARLPADWTPVQRVRTFQLGKIMGGNDFKDPIGPSGAVVLRTAIEYAQSIGPLCDPSGSVVIIPNLHHLALRVWYDLSGARKKGTAFPEIAAHPSDDMVHVHEQVRTDVAAVYRQRPDRPVAHGLVPSWDATRLSVGRAALYHEYVRAVLTPATPFTGWTQPGGGFALVEGVLLLHWDGADDRKVLGPKRALEAALKMKRSRQPLSAVPSPLPTAQEGKRVRTRPPWLDPSVYEV
jgi:hypothetical protein